MSEAETTNEMPPPLCPECGGESVKGYARDPESGDEVWVGWMCPGCLIFID